MRKWLGGILLGASVFSYGATLPGNLSSHELIEITRAVVSRTAVRALRSAESYETWPGLKFGLESTVAPISQLKDLGDAKGSVDGINIVPRLYLAKGLFKGAELIAVWFPDNVANTMGTLGGLLKYSFITEESRPVSFAGYLGITAVSAFESTFSGRNVELGIIVSKDFVRLKPYVGLGMSKSTGTLNPKYLIVGTENTASTLSNHLFAGIEFEFPMHITVQADLINLAPSVSLLISKHL
jgi:hypothetical protein